MGLVCLITVMPAGAGMGLWNLQPLPCYVQCHMHVFSWEEGPGLSLVPKVLSLLLQLQKFNHTAHLTSDSHLIPGGWSEPSSRIFDCPLDSQVCCQG